MGNKSCKLALKAVLGQKKHLSTQIFDEIDSGISGSTAEKVGELMKEMSVNQQIITITHLPQVAAKGTFICWYQNHMTMNQRPQMLFL